MAFPRDALGDTPPPDDFFPLLNRVAESVPPGSHGVLFTPWLNGERCPVEDRTLRAAFLNVSMTTERAHLVRAVMEGVAFNARWLLDAVERFIHRPLPSLRILGGGAVSDLWCQIHADVLDRTIERVAEPLHANLKGAALLAGLGLGRVRLDEVRDLVRVDGVFRPDGGTRGTYDRLYRELPKLYRAQKPMFARLNRRR